MLRNQLQPANLQWEVAAMQSTVEKLRGWFHCDFDGYSLPAARIVYRARSLPIADRDRLEPLLRVVAEKRVPVCISAEGSVALWGLPFETRGMNYVALGGFVTDFAQRRASDAVGVLGCSEEAAHLWLDGQPVWPHRGLASYLELVKRQLDDVQVKEGLHEENAALAASLTQAYEEITLFNELSQQLSLDIEPVKLGEKILQSLSRCIGARTVAAVWSHEAELKVLQQGEALPMDQIQVVYLQVSGLRQNQVFSNANQIAGNHIGGLIAVPIVDHDQVVGTLMAVGSTTGVDLGTIEAALLQTIAGVFGGFLRNRRLYTEARELFHESIRALTSAIDAKDPYTSGHSNRVALMARRLASEVGLTSSEAETVYLSGLLHDVGKIGINEQVLRKPGRLTDEEFAHIKLHPELGYRILKNIRRFNEFLPGVRHHHEAWDGSGYPDGLVGDAIPRQAQIIAVADALDAMTSDRPYRRGMPIEKVELILQEGRNVQWSSEVVDAFFRCRDDLLQIIEEGNNPTAYPTV